MRYIQVREKQIPIPIYIQEIKLAKNNLDREFKQGLTCWYPCTGQDIVNQFLAGLNDRINQSISYIQRGKIQVKILTVQEKREIVNNFIKCVIAKRFRLSVGGYACQILFEKTDRYIYDRKARYFTINFSNTKYMNIFLTGTEENELQKLLGITNKADHHYYFGSN
jgi:hypothetical protein